MSQPVSQRYVASEFTRSRISEGKLSPGERVCDFVLAKKIRVSRTRMVVSGAGDPSERGH
ncbi:MAG: hypothetical protein WD490_00290 [Opitutales bacterium]